jgi:hypothetical protein
MLGAISGGPLAVVAAVTVLFTDYPSALRAAHDMLGTGSVVTPGFLALLHAAAAATLQVSAREAAGPLAGATAHSAGLRAESQVRGLGQGVIDEGVSEFRSLSVVSQHERVLDLGGHDFLYRQEGNLGLDPIPLLEFSDLLLPQSLQFLPGNAGHLLLGFGGEVMTHLRQFALQPLRQFSTAPFEGVLNPLLDEPVPH